MYRETYAFLVAALTWSFILIGLATMAGCQAAKTVYDACMDGQCR